MPDYEPLPPPPPKASDHGPPSLTPDQEALYKQVLEHFTKPEYTLSNDEKGDLSEEEKFWLSYECLLRYLRASKWSAVQAIERIEDSLKWRREYGLYDKITAEYIEPEQLTGKQVLFGYDTSNRPAVYMVPSRQNTEESPRQMHHAIWYLERTIDLMPAGTETLTLMINFADKSQNTSFSMARSYLTILQSHYPERLGKAMILNLPFLINAFFKLVAPFIDPVTRDKMKFNPNVIKDELFSADMALQEWGGDRVIEYVHDKYFPALVKLTGERKMVWMETWRSLGGTVGIKEWDYKGGSSEVSEKGSGDVAT